MRMPKFKNVLCLSVVVSLALDTAAFCQAAEISFTNLVSFYGTNGASPEGLMQDLDGNLYGTTLMGGLYNKGTVFKLSPAGVLTTLASFDGTNGKGPQCAPVRGSDGNLYGTASHGGIYPGPYGDGYGTVYRLKPDGTLTCLLSFNGSTGDWPATSLIEGADGYFYGTTYNGGPYIDPAPFSTVALGTIFRIRADGTFTNLIFFDGTNGAHPWAQLVKADDGGFYGTCYDGTIYHLNPSGMLTRLYSGIPGGPRHGVVLSADDVLYGTTDGYSGYMGDYGSVFKLAPNGSFTTLFSFGGTNGNLPRRVFQATDGNLYGVTGSGGAGYGTIFKITPQGTFTTLRVFNGTEGYSAFGGMIQGSDGAFYGTTTLGGTGSSGTIFRLVVPGADAPLIQSASVSNGMISLCWTALLNRSYQLQYKTDSAQPSWTDAGAPYVATNLRATVYDSLGSDPQRFCRIGLLP